MNKNRVVVIGCGNVGMSYIYASLNQRTYINEICLIDLNEDRIVGEAMDLNHCLAFAPSKISIKVGKYSDCKDASIVVIAAGANQGPNETRMDLINKNSVIFKTIIDNVMKEGFDGIFIVATNPLDVMTYLTYKYSKLPSYKVIGTGTSLDTSRLRYLISDKLGVSPKSVHGYVIGEHGDSEFVPWSNMVIGLQPIKDFLTINEMNNIEKDVREAAYEIIKRKDATYYGIGMCLVRITNAILGDEKIIVTVSNYDEKNDIYIGLPAIICLKGISKKIYFNLTNKEKKKLNNSIKIIKEAIKKVE